MRTIFFSILLTVGLSLTMAQQNQPPALSLTEQLAFSTVRIEVVIKGQKGFGTGFFFAFLKRDDGSDIPAIVTNKHVVEGATEGKFVLTKQNADGSPNLTDHFSVSLLDFQSNWIPHPRADVDLAIMPIARILVEAQKRNAKIFFRKLDKTLIPSSAFLKDLTAVEDILMVGYPIGIFDRVNNYPVFRKGITATHPANNYDGRAEFMIDAACYPGSSGSPVFLYNMGSYPIKPGGLAVGDRFLFLGVLYGGPQFQATGDVTIQTIPHRQDIISKTLIPVNLGNVVRSELLLDFETVLQKLENK